MWVAASTASERGAVSCILTSGLWGPSVRGGRVARQRCQLVGSLGPGIVVGQGGDPFADAGPDFRQFGVDRQPGLHPRFGIRPDSIDRTFRLADAAIDALAGVDHQHVLARVEAVHWADLHAIGVLAGDARFGDDIGHGGPHFRLYTNDNAVTLALSRSMNVRGNSARCKQRNTPRPQGRGALTLWSDLAQSVLAGDFLDLQSAHPWQGTAAVGHGHGDDD